MGLTCDWQLLGVFFNTSNLSQLIVTFGCLKMFYSLLHPLLSSPPPEKQDGGFKNKVESSKRPSTNDVTVVYWGLVAAGPVRVFRARRVPSICWSFILLYILYPWTYNSFWLRVGTLRGRNLARPALRGFSSTKGIPLVCFLLWRFSLMVLRPIRRM